MEKRYSSISELLKDLRSKRGMTQKQFAEIIGIPTQSYAKYESGILRPGYGNLSKLARALDFDIDTIIDTGMPDESEIYNQRLKRQKDEETQKRVNRYTVEINEILSLLNSRGKEHILEYARFLSQNKKYLKGTSGSNEDTGAGTDD